MSDGERELSVYSIGHSNHTMEVFLRLLGEHKIEVLIDTRSSPFSRYSPHFNRDELKADLYTVGIKYGYYGRHLGGRPDDEDYYDDTGRVDYARVAKSFLFNEGLEHLMRGIQSRRTALMCSEENPSICHRRLLLSRVLYEQGVIVLHVRGNGVVQTEEELRRAEEAERSKQRGLFEGEELPEWKSIQSVLHKVRPHTFSEG